MPDGHHTDSEPRRSSDPRLAGTNLERAGGYNQRVTLQAIRVNGPVTRNDLVDHTGLTAPAIANITRRLLDDRLIRELGRIKGARGQPAMRFEINPEGRFAIGMNIDRDHVTIVAVDFLGSVKARASRSMEFAVPRDVTAFFAATLEDFLKDGSIPRDHLIGVGIAMPDDIEKGHFDNQQEDYLAWRDVDIAQMIGELIDVPVFVENDAAAAAIGELQFGHGLQTSSFLYMLVTVGLGGGLVIDGQYVRGAHGRSGEVGFLRGFSTEAGAQRLHEVLSLSGLTRYLAGRGIEVAGPGDMERLVCEGAAALDDWVAQVVDMMIEPMIATACLIDPEAVYIGGRLPCALVDRLAQGVTSALRNKADEMPSPLTVSRAALSEDAPAVGAAILPFSDILLPTRDSLMKALPA